MPEEETKAGLAGDSAKEGRDFEAELKEFQRRNAASLPQYPYTEDGEEVQLPGTGRACENLRLQLRACVLKSDCVQKKGLSPKDCINQAHYSVAPECFQLRNSFVGCKRSTVDPRARFRGRKGDTQ